MAKNKELSLELETAEVVEASAEKNGTVDVNIAKAEVSNPVPTKPETKYVTVVKCDKLRVRAEASTDAAVLAIVSKGTKLIFKNKKDNTWSHVQTLTGKDGYVMSEFISK